jgi:hypothetical protein
MTVLIISQKELGEKSTAATDQIRQLLPLPKLSCEVITVEPYGAVLDNKGNRVQGFDAIGKKLVSSALFNNLSSLSDFLQYLSFLFMEIFI